MTEVKDISDLANNFKELQDFSDASMKVIKDLQKKISQLESENTSLKTMLESNIPNIELQVTDFGIGISNEQLICETQILLLKNEAVMRPLTMEETRKLDTFVNVLEKVKKKTPNGQDYSIKLTDEELVKMAKDNNVI